MACQEAFDAHFFVHQMPLELYGKVEYYVNKELRGKNKVHNLF